MKKILLVSANRHTAPYPVYPLGIAYLAAGLKKNLPGYEVRAFDMLADDHAAYAAYLQSYRPDYVGISIRNIDSMDMRDDGNFLGWYRRLISATRSNCPATIVIGGPGYSIYPQALFDYLKPDFAVQGEGEESLCALVRALDSHADFRGIEGLVYSTGDAARINRRVHYACDASVCYDKRLVNFYWRHGGMLSIQTKRGCPYRCIYCSYPLIEGGSVRTLDADSVVEALADLRFGKKIDHVFFSDSVFNLCNDYNVELAEKIIRRNMGLKWGGYFNAVDLDEKFLTTLKRAGLTHIEFGTESLCDATLKHYGKPFSVGDIIEASRLCSRLNINFAHFLIFGGYGETAETIQETFENSKKLGRTVFFPYIGMRIYPGTRLQALAIAEKKIRADDPLLDPVYYIADAADMDLLKKKARQTGRAWIFPDEDLSPVMRKMRERNKKGPLWEYLIS